MSNLCCLSAVDIVTAFAHLIKQEQYKLLSGAKVQGRKIQLGFGHSLMTLGFSYASLY